MSGDAFAPRVVRLTSDDASRIVGVYCDAFRDYPVMRFVIGDAGDEYEERLHGMVGLFVAARVLRQEPLFGIEGGGELVAAATVSFPGTGETPGAFEGLREAVWHDLGSEARARYEACGEVWRELGVDVPHVHLNMIGVRRTAQGLGLAGRLLEAVHALSRESPDSEGVTLTTEDPANVAFYRKAGYDVVGRKEIAPGLETWGFFRRD